MERDQVLKLFGCTEEQLKKQYEANAKQLTWMRDKAKSTGKKYCGFTYEQLAERTIAFEQLAK